MNFLAHLYLSGKDKSGVLVGNFIADQVKGKQLASFPKNMQRGIRLHRKIDEFTDSHEVTARCKKG
jgi:acyl carrier protein phosphodiesterase